MFPFARFSRTGEDMAADFHRARREAERLIEKYDIRKPPIDPEAIAEAEGVRVVYAAFNGDIDKKLSGFTDSMNDTIVINRSIPANRKTFTIAHELGHHVMHREYLDDDGAYQVFARFNEYAENKPDEEKEADAFAANLLVPMKLLRRYKNVASNHELARLFCVSDAVILHRLSQACPNPFHALRGFVRVAPDQRSTKLPHS